MKKFFIFLRAKLFEQILVDILQFCIFVSGSVDPQICVDLVLETVALL